MLEHLALHEYRLLRDLTRLDTPSVEAVGVVTDRLDADGEPLDPILITRHLQFSLPYRSLFSRGVRQDTVNRLVDAMVVLLARLHLIGFLWGDVSLSNTLFRRDAGAFAAYLVDAETGELHDELTNGQREHDLTIARTNLFGEFCDLEAGGLLDEALDPLVLVETIENRYRELWAELTDVEEFDTGEMHRIESRVRRLNALGFDVAELDITTDFAGSTVRIQPKVVDAGHHSAPADPADRAGHRGEPGPPAAERPRLLPRPDRPAGRRRVDRRPPVADRALRAGRATPCRRRCGPSSNRPSSTTRCWSTGGS